MTDFGHLSRGGGQRFSWLGGGIVDFNFFPEGDRVGPSSPPWGQVLVDEVFFLDLDFVLIAGFDG